jgi:hypothetical protein
MGTGFSHTDHTYVNQNHDISLVVAHSGIAGQIRSKVPCGAMMITDAKVKMSFSVEGFEKDKFIEKVKTNIKKPTYHYTQPAQPPYQQGKPGGGSGYWFNGKWHKADPIKRAVEATDDNEVEKEIDRIHKSEDGTLAHYWTCPHCQQQNYTQGTIVCWSCRKLRMPETGAWMCSYCKGVNNRVDGTSCIFCKTVRSLAAPIETTLAEQNQKKIEDEWNRNKTLAVRSNENHECKKCKKVYIYQIGEEIICPKCDIEGDGKVEVDTNGWSSGIPQKHLGMYNCGRCQGKWEDVDLRKFTECPNCDRIVSGEKTLEDELKEEFDEADKEIEQTINNLKNLAEEEKKRLNTSATDAEAHTQITTPGPLVAGAETPLDEDVHFCRICKLVVLRANSVHKACLAQEQGEGNYPCKFCGQPIGVPNAYHVDCFEKKQAGVKPKEDIWESEANEPVV